MRTLDIDFKEVKDIFKEKKGEGNLTDSSEKKEFKKPKLKNLNPIKDKKKDTNVREIIIIKESQTPVIKHYLNTKYLNGFKYYEGTSHFKTISNLKENLLDDPYWVIATVGKNSITPPKLNYDIEVIDKYVNHIIITNNWGIFDKINKEDFTMNIMLGDKEYKYKVKTLASLGDEAINNYIESKLSPIMTAFEIERTISLLHEVGIKNVVENVEKFVAMKGFPFEDVVRSIEKDVNITYSINSILKSLCTKKGIKKWKEPIKDVVKSHGEKYLLKSLNNGVEAIMQLKLEGKTEHMSSKYLYTFIKEVDMLDLVYLRYTLSKKGLSKVLINLENYMKTPTKELIRNV